MHLLTKTVLRRPVAAIVIVAALIIFGISSITGMNLQLIPDMDMPIMMVSTSYPSTSPEDIERLVTKKIEEGCNTIKGIKQTTSQSSEGFSMVMFQFEYGTNMDETFTDMQAAIQRVKGALPDNASDPVIYKMDFNAQSSVDLSVDSTDKTLDLRNYADKTVQDALKTISSVSDVSISGGDERYISVTVLPEYMGQYNLTLAEIANAINGANYVAPAGNADYGTQKVAVSAKAEYKTPEQISTIPIQIGTGDMIHLGDVAKVGYASKEKTSYSRYDQADNISVSITKNQDASAVTLSNAVKDKIAELNAAHPEATITIVYDDADSIKSSINSVAQTLGLGIVITMFILLLFFGDLKASLIVGSSMPVSLLMTFILMAAMGFSLNMITMGALVIGIGMMVDNSIVVIEMCFRKRDEGLTFMDAAYEATKQVMMSIIASTITSVVVYLPLANMKGLSGQMFGQLGYTIVFALLASLFSAITLVPLCFSFYRPVEKKESRINRILERISQRYGNLLEKALKRRKTVAFSAIAILFISFYLVRFVNMELMSSTDQGQVSITMSMRPGTRIETLDEKIKEMEDFVARQEEIDHFSTTVSESSSQAIVKAFVADGVSKSSNDIANEWTLQLLSGQDNADIEVAASSDWGSSGGGDNSYEIDFHSKDLDALKQACAQISDELARVNGVLGASSSFADAATKAQIKIDPVKAAAAGVTPSTAASSLYGMVSGLDTVDVTVDGEEYTVTVEYPGDTYQTTNDIYYSAMLTNNAGSKVPLSEIADIVYTDSPTSITRTDGFYSGNVKCTIDGETRFETQGVIDQAVAGLSLPAGVSRVENALQQRQSEEFTALGKAILTAIILVYMVMAIQFENLRYSGMVMFCIPFSLIGSILLLLITRSTLSMTSLMGFLMLIGIVVNNGILYVDSTNEMRKTMSTAEALVLTGKSRLRPILMTTLTTILSMIPMAVGYGKNGKTTQGMAVVIVGGLTASTILTLVLLPTLYMMIHNRSKAKKQKKEHKLFGKSGKKKEKKAKENPQEAPEEKPSDDTENK